MILYIDQGNTSTKWWLVDGKNIVASNSALGVSLAGLTDALASARVVQGAETKINAAWVSNVAGDTAAAKLSDLLLQFLPMAAIHFACVRSDFAGVTAAYVDVSALGVDRWLSMLAAHHHFSGEKLIFSFGTAITVDKLTASGGHEGGLIAPGWHMLKDMVPSRTANIRTEVDMATGDIALGKSTEQCLSAGVSLMARAFFECANRQFASEGCRRILTGGDASLMHSLSIVEGMVSVEPGLVLKGLQVYSTYSQ